MCRLAADTMSVLAHRPLWTDSLTDTDRAVVKLIAVESLPQLMRLAEVAV